MSARRQAAPRVALQLAGEIFWAERSRCEKMDPPSGSATRKREALERLIAHYEAWGRPEDAARWRKATGPTPDQAR